jgi:hypothetical protein
MKKRANTTPNKPTAPRELSAHDYRRLAVEAAVHPTTVRRYLAGEQVRSTCRIHVERALAVLGMTELVRAA